MIREKETVKQAEVTSQRRVSTLERLSIQATEQVGSVTSLIIHTVLFMGIFSLRIVDFSVEEILLILTTIVSLEAIYLAIFIQMTVNRQAAGLAEVQEDIEDIQEDVEEISEDIEGIQGEVKDLSEDVEDISEDIEEDDREDEQIHRATTAKLDQIEVALHQLLKDIGDIRGKK